MLLLSARLLLAVVQNKFSCEHISFLLLYVSGVQGSQPEQCLCEIENLGLPNIFSDEGRFWVDVGWMWGGFGLDVGWMWGGCGVDVGWMWGGYGRFVLIVMYK